MALRTTTSSGGHTRCLLLTVLFVHACPSKWRGTREDRGQRTQGNRKEMCQEHACMSSTPGFSCECIGLRCSRTQKSKVRSARETARQSGIGIMHFIYLEYRRPTELLRLVGPRALTQQPTLGSNAEKSEEPVLCNLSVMTRKKKKKSSIARHNRCSHVMTGECFSAERW